MKSVDNKEEENEETFFERPSEKRSPKRKLGVEMSDLIKIDANFQIFEKLHYVSLSEIPSKIPKDEELIGRFSLLLISPIYL